MAAPIVTQGSQPAAGDSSGNEQRHGTRYGSSALCKPHTRIILVLALGLLQWHRHSGLRMR